MALLAVVLLVSACAGGGGSETANAPPAVAITKAELPDGTPVPLDGTVTTGATVLFEALAQDLEDGDLTAQIRWLVNDASTGTPGGMFSFSAAGFGEGTFTVSSTVADRGRLSDSSGFQFRVEACPLAISATQITNLLGGGTLHEGCPLAPPFAGEFGGFASTTQPQTVTGTVASTPLTTANAAVRLGTDSAPLRITGALTIKPGVLDTEVVVGPVILSAGAMLVLANGAVNQFKSIRVEGPVTSLDSTTTFEITAFQQIVVASPVPMPSPTIAAGTVNLILSGQSAPSRDVIIHGRTSP